MLQTCAWSAKKGGSKTQLLSLSCTLQRLCHLAFIELSVVTTVRQLHEWEQLRVEKWMKILFKSINSVLLRFSYLSSARGINVVYLSLLKLPEINYQQYFGPCNTQFMPLPSPVFLICLTFLSEKLQVNLEMWHDCHWPSLPWNPRVPTTLPLFCLVFKHHWGKCERVFHQISIIALKKHRFCLKFRLTVYLSRGLPSCSWLCSSGLCVLQCCCN